MSAPDGSDTTTAMSSQASSGTAVSTTSLCHCVKLQPGVEVHTGGVTCAQGVGVPVQEISMLHGLCDAGACRY
jgi:hypothetical protein